MLAFRVIKIEYRRALHKSSGKPHLPESPRLPEPPRLPESSRLHKSIFERAKLNRQTPEFKCPVTDGKQTTAARSNRQIFQTRGFCVRHGGPDVRVPQPPVALQAVDSSGVSAPEVRVTNTSAIYGRHHSHSPLATHHCSEFLTGSGSQTEFA